MTFERRKNRAAFILKGVTYVSELYVNAERLGDALIASHFSRVGTVAESRDFALLWCPSIAAGPEMKH